MNRLICVFSLLFCPFVIAQEDLRSDLETSYNTWRNAILRKDAASWQNATAPHRRVEVRNRILSEKRAFPAGVFDLPAPPPSIKNLKFLDAKQNGATAKASYFGAIDFGLGGSPSDNLLVLSFVRGVRGWLYDRADVVNLASLPDVRKELAAGNLNYLKETPEAQPSGVVPPWTSAKSLCNASVKRFQERARSERASTQELTTSLRVEPFDVRRR